MTTAINTTMGLGEWIMLILLGAVWGGSFYLIAIAVTELPPLTIVLLRVGFAAITLWLILLSTKAHIPTAPRIWFAFLTMGCLNNVIPFSLIVWGQQHIASGLAAILNATTPIFTVVLAGLFLTDEKITAGKLLGAVLGFAGVVVMIGPALGTGLDTHVIGQIAVLGAAVSYGFAATYGRRFRTMNIGPIMTATGQVTASTLVLLPITLLIDQPFSLPMPGLNVWASILAMAVVCTAYAYILYFRILSSAGATNLALVTLLVPVTAILLGSLLLGERLDAVHLIGMLLIAVGMVVIDGRLWRHINHSHN